MENLIKDCCTFNIIDLTVVGVLITTPLLSLAISSFFNIDGSISELRSKFNVKILFCMIAENVDRITDLENSSSAGGTT
jgi:hypothetical protein